MRREAAAREATSSVPAVSCCWEFVETTKRYRYYVRPADTQCAASYKLAQCPKNVAAPASPASAPGAAAGREPQSVEHTVSTP